MIRKIIAQGKGAHTVTLPAKWISMNHLKAGDEVNLIDKDSDLIVTAKSKHESPKMTGSINCKGVHWLVAPLVASYYKRGYDELRVEFQNSKEVERMNWIVSQLPGFEVIEKRANVAVIKRIASASIEEYKNSVRRSCFTLKVMSEEFIEALEKNDQELMKSVLMSDDNLNKFTNYARHIIMKDSSVEPVKAPSMHSLLWALEKMGDVYKRLAQLHTEKKVKISKETIEMHKKILKLLTEFLDLIYKYDQDSLNHFYEKKKQFFRDMETLLAKTKGDETIHVSQLNVLVSLIFDCTTLVIVQHI